MNASDYMDSIGVPHLTEVRFYDDEKGEYISYNLMGMLADFKDKLVKEYDSLQCVSNRFKTKRVSSDGVFFRCDNYGQTKQTTNRARAN